jgi:hypothetical protein
MLRVLTPLEGAGCVHTGVKGGQPPTKATERTRVMSVYNRMLLYLVLIGLATADERATSSQQGLAASF